MRKLASWILLLACGACAQDGGRDCEKLCKRLKCCRLLPSPLGLGETNCAERCKLTKPGGGSSDRMGLKGDLVQECRDLSSCIEVAECLRERSVAADLSGLGHLVVDVEFKESDPCEDMIPPPVWSCTDFPFCQKGQSDLADTGIGDAGIGTDAGAGMDCRDPRDAGDGGVRAACESDLDASADAGDLSNLSGEKACLVEGATISEFFLYPVPAPRGQMLAESRDTASDPRVPDRTGAGQTLLAPAACVSGRASLGPFPIAAGPYVPSIKLLGSRPVEGDAGVPSSEPYCRVARFRAKIFMVQAGGTNVVRLSVLPNGGAKLASNLGWKGELASFDACESSCDDAVDDDGDGRIDCADPACAGTPACACEMPPCGNMADEVTSDDSTERESDMADEDAGAAQLRGLDAGTNDGGRESTRLGGTG